MSDHIHRFRDKDGRDVAVHMNRPMLDPDTVDEIFAEGVHLEQMARNCYWMSVCGVHFYFHARGKITLTYSVQKAEEVAR